MYMQTIFLLSLFVLSSCCEGGDTNSIPRGNFQCSNDEVIVNCLANPCDVTSCDVSASHFDIIIFLPVGFSAILPLIVLRITVEVVTQNFMLTANWWSANLLQLFSHSCIF